jgi:beta-glucosidase
VKEAHVGSVMCSYNRLNGPYACENGRLLHDILERDWGFQGYVIADYGAAHDTPANLTGGLDFEPWPGLAYSPPLVTAATLTPGAAQATIDEHVHRILRTLFAYGFFDRAAFADDDAQIDKAAHARVAERIEEGAVTLLENRDAALPLDAARLHSLAIVGADADTFKTGGGSGAVTPFDVVTPREAITQRAGPGVRVTYDDGSDPAAAAAAAKAADVAIVFAGDYQTEGTDKRCLTLECPSYRGDQDALIERVAGANPNTIVVLETGGPVLTPWRDRVSRPARGVVPGSGGRDGDRARALRRRRPGRAAAGHLPGQRGRRAHGRRSREVPGRGRDRHLQEGVLVGYR